MNALHVFITDSILSKISTKFNRIFTGRALDVLGDFFFICLTFYPSLAFVNITLESDEKKTLF